MEEIPHWSLNHTALLGDACHPDLPFGFSGASMATEDGVTLSALLSSDVRADEIPERLELYEEVRKPRVTRVWEASLDVAKGSENHDFMRSYTKFLSLHDAVQHAERALSAHLKAS